MNVTVIKFSFHEMQNFKKWTDHFYITHQKKEEESEEESEEEEEEPVKATTTSSSRVCLSRYQWETKLESFIVYFMFNFQQSKTLFGVVTHITQW